MHKEIRNTLAYIVVASLVVITAIWQAQVSAARDLEARHRSLPPPPKTKHAIRPALQVFTGDVVADYVARCEKGMTDREIGWILEDYKNAGLDLDWRNPAVTIEELFRLRAAKLRWYHDALVDGWHLSPAQSTQVTQTLDELSEKFKQAVLAEEESKSNPSDSRLNDFEPIDRYTRESIADLSGSMIAFSSVPIATPYFPWKLCQLTPAQEKLTWKLLFSAFESPNHDILSEETTELSGDLLFRPESLYEGYPIDESLDIQTSLPNLIFPLLTRQKLIAKNDPNGVFSEPSDPPGLSALENVRLLHPCQLKALLLFNPTLASKIESDMGSESH